MKNDEGEVVDLYIPRKCAWTNKLITAKDHASVQINIGHLDGEGVYSGTFTTYAFSGAVRQRGEGDSALDLLWKKKSVEA
ncbi:40S ribosomal protein S21 [Monoraphidium neglectum]|uniref:40S ribosomal protein S21 n=1 Tax=Monoraphidium neglectum TaxID=145388 RepID=A0A0D2MQF1_9CHLO|nr:40S ribosomal protein S21 [Monoraphidium neglectum]KIY96895.1 40S ribosomal protein S21 [Monoraphidium neglectum]|eukprot:XP_013895915.1 40S ribosomal protein S21 [Monoraphidium neglectum]